MTTTIKITFQALTIALSAALFSGCASTESARTGSQDSSQHFATRYHSTDGRTVEIGKRVAADGGWKFKEPHLDKCWIADGFDFKGNYALFIAPVTSTVKVHEDEVAAQELAKKNLAYALESTLAPKGLFSKVTQDQAALPAGMHTLKLENTIIKYSKGGGGARYWAGVYGAGQPVVRVQGRLMDGDKVVFSYEAERSGVSAGARMFGAFAKDEDIQIEDIRSLALDVGDFISAIAGQYQPLN